MKDDYIYIRAVSEEEPLSSLDFKYCTVFVTPEFKQERYYENLSAVVKFIYDTFEDH